MRLGPADPLRSTDAPALLPASRAAAAQAGVTRLADITRLDRIGLPVWQAVRPMSRALSVHQGKGASAEDAQLGALLEAVESHAAEGFTAAGTFCAFEELLPADRAFDIADFAADRRRPPSVREPVEWVAGIPLPGCTGLLLPLPLVSLDFTADGASMFDRASNGVATAGTREEALFVALHELIERDAVVEWLAGDIADRIACTVTPATIPCGWYHDIAERVEAEGARLRCYLVQSLTGTPVFACEINDPHKEALPYRTANGRAAHPLPEIALFKAVAEACQARAAFIAGARDDLYPSRYGATETSILSAFGFPVPPGMATVDFASIGQGPQTLESLCAALVHAGYSQGTAITLAEPPGLCVVRAFVSGLGSMSRRRRAVDH